MSTKDDTESRTAQVYATTRHGKLSLDQMAALMPGLGTLMPVIADRFGWMVHAARGGNWKLAGYQLRKVRHLFRVGKTTRPKWTEVIDRYLAGSLEPIDEAIAARALDRFELAVSQAVQEANRIHVQYGYGYIRYKLPAAGPDHMELGPIEED